MRTRESQLLCTRHAAPMARERRLWAWLLLLCVAAAAPRLVSSNLGHPAWLARATPPWKPRFGACAVALNNVTFVIGGAGHFADPGPSSAVGGL